jgi:hypothetical protein
MRLDLYIVHILGAEAWLEPIGHRSAALPWRGLEWLVTTTMGYSSILTESEKREEMKKTLACSAPAMCPRDDLPSPTLPGGVLYCTVQ